MTLLSRIDIIGQNGPTGEHYEELDKKSDVPKPAASDSTSSSVRQDTPDTRDRIRLPEDLP